MEIGSSTAGALGGITSESTSSTMGPDAFLRLLVTQIRNQDPMEPMDTDAMMGQLTQLTEVERLVAIDGRLETLGIATAGIANSSASDLLGRYVEADTSHLLLSEGGSTEGAFQLTTGAASTSVEIRDASGNVVRTLALGPHAAGAAHFTWDGRDETGASMPSGRYSVTVHATDSDGRVVGVELAARGTVDAVSYEGGYPSLTIGGSEVVLGDVRRVGSAPPRSTGAPGASAAAATAAAAASAATSAASAATTTAAAPTDPITGTTSTAAP